MKIPTGRVLMIVMVLAVMTGLVVALIPRRVMVDVGHVTRGPLQVTVSEDGRTRIRERYVVSSPLAGRIQRIALRAGDRVKGGTTVLTTLAPVDPALLDARALAESDARVRRADAALQRARPMLEQARARFEFSEGELARVQKALNQGAATQRELDDALLAYRSANEDLSAARFAEEIARYELELAEAALLHTRPDGSGTSHVEHLVIVAPVDGSILRVFQESMAVVSPGTPLVEVGDPADLEVEVDVLSADAVRILPGARVYFEHWGGPHVLHGRVRLIEPRAFTRVSALGVEEQRVYVIATFDDPPETRLALGDAYRVEARIVVWEEQDVLQVPTSAIFRVGQEWAVFVVEHNRARLRPVKLGRRTDVSSQVLDGVAERDVVILHPGDNISEGTRIQPHR